MNLWLLGWDQDKTPLALRETLNPLGSEVPELLRELRNTPGVLSCVLISTCNRLELVVHGNVDRESDRGFFALLGATLCALRHADPQELLPRGYCHAGEHVVRHLMEVACGLHSVVLGEDQILGQIKEAHRVSRETGTCDAMLNTLFRDVVALAKAIKTGTQLSSVSVSVSSVAVQRMVRSFGDDFHRCRAMVIGAGEMGRLAMKHLLSLGIGGVYVTSRRHGEPTGVQDMPEGVEVIDYDQRYAYADRCDVLISATTSPHLTLECQRLQGVLHTRRRRMVVDLAVPRDVDPAVATLPDTELITVDDLKEVVDANLKLRMAAAEEARERIQEGVAAFVRWHDFQRVLPVVQGLQEHAMAIAQQRTASALSRLRHLDPADQSVIRQVVSGTAMEVAATFLYEAKKYGSLQDMQAYFRCLEEWLSEHPAEPPANT